MAISGIKFTIDADNTKSLSAIRQVMSAAKDAGKQMQQAFGQKLKQVISIAALEEGIRRTAEWAQEVDRFSRNLGISRETFQTLEIISKRTGQSMDTVTGLFENIQKSRKQALAGNQELIKSFGALGITMKDLRDKTPTALFSETMGKINLKNATNLQRLSIENITGTPENTIQDIKENGMGGKSLEENTAQLKSEGGIASEETISGIAQTWNEFLTSIKELGNSMAWLVKLILGIVKMLVDAVSGVFDTISELGSLLMGIITLDKEKIFKSFHGLTTILANMGYGIMKLVTGLLELIPGVKKFGLTKAIQETQDKANLDWGSNKKYAKHGEALGEAVGSILGGEAGAVAARSATGTKLINKALKPMGMEARSYTAGEKAIDRWRNSAQKQDYMTGRMQSQIDALEARPPSSLTAQEARTLANKREYMEMAGKTMGDEMHIVKVGSRTKMPAWKRSFRNAATWGINSVGARIGLVAGAGLFGQYAGRQGNETPPISEMPPAVPMLGQGMGFMSDTGGSANLKLGGMFGQSTNKLIKLNTDMVTLLGLIKDNTTVFANNNQLLAGGAGGFGGVSGGL